MPLISTENKSQPLPSRLVALLRESRWLLFAAAALYVIIILYGYDRNDPAWSHSSSTAAAHNPGGVFGAWLADLLLYVFGFSAWWLIVLLLQRVWLGYRGISAAEPPEAGIFDRRALWVALSGFAVLLLSSSALEALRLYHLKVALPQAPGGMLGAILGNGLSHLLGFTGSTLFLLALVATGFSLFSGLSWLRFIDRLGYLLETGYLRAVDAWQTRRDRRIGEQAAVARTAVV